MLKRSRFKKIEHCRSCINTFPLFSDTVRDVPLTYRRTMFLPFYPQYHVKGVNERCISCKEFYGTPETSYLCSNCWLQDLITTRKDTNNTTMTPALKDLRHRLSIIDLSRFDAVKYENIHFYIWCNQRGLAYRVWSDTQFKILTSQLHGKDPGEVEAALRGFRDYMPATAMTASQGVYLNNYCVKATPQHLGTTQEDGSSYIHAIFPFVVDPWNIKLETIDFHDDTVCDYYMNCNEGPTSFDALEKTWAQMIKRTSASKNHCDYIICDCAICLDGISSSANSVRCGQCRQSVHIACALQAFCHPNKVRCPSCRADWNFSGDIRDSPRVIVNFIQRVALIVFCEW